MDEMDWALLRELQVDARLSFSELSRRVHLSPPAVAELPLTRCLPDPNKFPATWTPPKDCLLPEGCVLLRPGSTVPVGGLVLPKGLVPPGTAFPAGTELPAGTVLSAPCVLPVTGAVTGQIGDLPDLLGGGLRP